MQIHEIKRKTKNRKTKLVGRGGKRGKTSGRGTKGQNARAGRKKRPEQRDIIKKLPKKRGYRFQSIQVKPVLIKLDILSKTFKDGDVVKPSTILSKGIITLKKGLIPKIKILSDGEIDKKLTISGCAVSEAAKQKIEKAGGMVK